MATYLDNAGVTQILTKIKSLLAKKAEITAIPTKVSQLTNDSQYQNATEVNSKIDTKLGELSVPTTGGETKYICSISQTNGEISAVEKDFDNSVDNRITTLLNRGSLADQSFVMERIENAVGKITSFEYKIVDSLPATSEGKKGVIYLIAHSGSTNQNSYDEYIFLPAEGSTAARYEKIGTTDIDLTPYAKKTDIPKKVSQLTNDSDFETKTNVGSRITTAINSLDKADTAVEGKYVSAVSETDGVITVTRASLPAVGTADSPISNATIESIFTQVFG